MKLDFKTVQSPIKNQPLAIDKTSSSTVNYIRKNIRRTAVYNVFSKETSEIWQYEEAKVSKDDFEKYYDSIISNLEMTEVQQLLTDFDIDRIVTEQSLTDFDIRICALEG